jgi:hypothetical protein
MISYVFAHLHERTETIIVSVLGLMYATSQVLGIGQANLMLLLASASDQTQARLKAIAAGIDYDGDDLNQKAKGMLKRFNTKMNIEKGFLWIVMAICLVELLLVL